MPFFFFTIDFGEVTSLPTNPVFDATRCKKFDYVGLEKWPELLVARVRPDGRVVTVLEGVSMHIFLDFFFSLVVVVTLRK